MSKKLKITNPKKVTVGTIGLEIGPESSVTMTESEWSKLLEKNKYVRLAVTSKHLIVTTVGTRKRK